MQGKILFGLGLISLLAVLNASRDETEDTSTKRSLWPRSLARTGFPKYRSLFDLRHGHHSHRRPTKQDYYSQLLNRRRLPRNPRYHVRGGQGYGSPRRRFGRHNRHSIRNNRRYGRPSVRYNPLSVGDNRRDRRPYGGRNRLYGRRNRRRYLRYIRHLRYMDYLRRSHGEPSYRGYVRFMRRALRRLLGRRNGAGISMNDRHNNGQRAYGSQGSRAATTAKQGQPGVTYTSSGEKCVFPFVYRGTTYNRCTMADHKAKWCATTSNYDSDKQWGACAAAAEESPQQEQVWGWCFGYGSIVTTHADKGLSVRVRIVYRRVWNAHNTKARATFLGLQPTPGQLNEIVGLVTPIYTEEEGKKLDDREQGYTKVLIPFSNITVDKEWNQALAKKFKPSSKIFVYVPQKTTDVPSAAYPILQSYIDLVVKGFMKLGLAKEFLKTTYGWSPYVLNDRAPHARRPWVGEKKHSKIDKLLQETASGASYYPALYPEDFVARYQDELNQWLDDNLGPKDSGIEFADGWMRYVGKQRQRPRQHRLSPYYRYGYDKQRLSHYREGYDKQRMPDSRGGYDMQPLPDSRVDDAFRLEDDMAVY